MRLALPRRDGSSGRMELSATVRRVTPEAGARLVGMTFDALDPAREAELAALLESVSVKPVDGARRAPPDPAGSGPEELESLESPE